jgi:hypothetical protein
LIALGAPHPLWLAGEGGQPELCGATFTELASYGGAAAQKEASALEWLLKEGTPTRRSPARDPLATKWPRFGKISMDGSRLDWEDLMTKRLIFSVATPLGYRVSLSRDRWRQITRFKHPALSGHENDVRDCLRNPVCVRESAKDSSVHLFYRESESVFLCVVTAPASDDDRFVVTAYFTTNIKEGNEIWKR